LNSSSNGDVDDNCDDSDNGGCSWDNDKKNVYGLPRNPSSIYHVKK